MAEGHAGSGSVGTSQWRQVPKPPIMHGKAWPGRRMRAEGSYSERARRTTLANRRSLAAATHHWGSLLTSHTMAQVSDTLAQVRGPRSPSKHGVEGCGMKTAEMTRSQGSASGNCRPAHAPSTRSGHTTTAACLVKRPGACERQPLSMYREAKGAPSSNMSGSPFRHLPWRSCTGA